MTPELIALLLAAPLDVRLALLDADPKGAGWFVGEYGASVYANPTCYCHLDSFKWLKEGRAAWLPCNPLAVIEVAARLFAARHGLPPSIELLGPDGDGGWTCRLVIARGVTVEAKGSRAEIGVRVLLGVVNA